MDQEAQLFPQRRQRRQRGVSRVKSRMYYRKNRNKAKMRSRRRYRVQRNRPMFKRKQKVRRQKPWRFKRRLGGIVPTDIALFDPSDNEIVGLKSINPDEGTVTLVKSEGEERDFPLEEILEDAEFLTWDDIEGFYDLLDEALLDPEDFEDARKEDHHDIEEFGGEPEEERLWGSEDDEWENRVNRVLAKYLGIARD